MGWEKRKSNTYFYLHQRLPDGRKVKQYCGKGFAAHMAANFLTLRKATKQIEAEALRQIQAETQEADELLRSYSKRVAELLTTEMFMAGFHNPRSRGWRKIMKTDSSVATECAGTSTATAGKKPRGSKGETSTGSKTAKPVTSQAPRQKHSSRSTSNGDAATMSPEEQQFHRQAHEKFMRELAANQAGKSGDGESDEPSEPTKPVEEMSLEELKAAAKGRNATAMKRLRPMMQKDARRYQTRGNLGGKALLKWLEIHCRGDLYQQECLQLNIRSMRTQHWKEGDTPIERLLIEEVLLCWLRHKHWIDLETSMHQKPPCFQSLKFCIEQTQQSQRMYLKALGKLQNFRNAKARLPSLAAQDETESA